MSTDNETVAEIVREMYAMPQDWIVDANANFVFTRYADRIEAAHKRDREAARRRAERSAIYNMLESFPQSWKCNPGAVESWLAEWQKRGDELCEGGEYAR